ncbi:MAG: hypothetical protein DI535_17720 [Citrobacter freundii]|nr:MAG: hypothetical protein DI535_17720 [Citrobacter freundii]
MSKTNKSAIIRKPRLDGQQTEQGLKIDQDGEDIPFIDSPDPEIVPPPEEELQITPPYEAPPDGEGP